MTIDTRFPGGNLTVLGEDEGGFTVEREMRDSTGDWFYWAFRIRGAAGKTLTFRFPSKNRVGYHGAAISTDLSEWRWPGGKFASDAGEGFTYTFAPDENEVYLAHDMLYPASRLARLTALPGMRLEELCISRRGRSVPLLRLGEGSRKILLTARHHACESTGSYVLEGVLSAFAEKPLPDTEIICVPFVDYDGVCDGDQGKNRAPHDHNRDYAPESPSVHPSCRAIRSLAEREPLMLAFDFHSPYHLGGRHDKVFFVHGNHAVSPKITEFGKLLEKHLTPEAMPYSTENDILPGVEWNSEKSTTCARYLLKKTTVRLAVTLETTYFGEPSQRVTQPRLTALGASFARAIEAYVSTL